MPCRGGVSQCPHCRKRWNALPGRRAARRFTGDLDELLADLVDSQWTVLLLPLPVAWPLAWSVAWPFAWPVSWPVPWPVAWPVALPVALPVACLGLAPVAVALGAALVVLVLGCCLFGLLVEFFLARQLQMVARINVCAAVF